MEAVQIQLEKRAATGKGAARKTRATGLIPGILYGHGQEPVMFAVDAHGFGLTLTKSPFGRNQVLALTGVGRDVHALVKELQVHPVSRAIIHVDLVEVRSDDKAVVEVPVRYTGKAAGQTAGGTLVLLRRTVKMLCPPLRIPSEIMIDVTPLAMGQDITVGSLPLPEGAVALGDPKVVVLTIKAPRAAKAAEGEEAAPAAAAKKK